MKIRGKHVRKAIKSNIPVLVLVNTVVGTIATAVTSAAATPKAIRHLSEAEQEKGGELTFLEKFQAVWKDYIPTGITTFTTIAGGVIGYKDSIERGVAATAAGALAAGSVETLATYKDKIAKEFGEEVEKRITGEVEKEQSEEKVQEKFRDKDLNTLLQSNRAGYDIFVDSLTMRPFQEAKTKVESVINCVTASLYEGASDKYGNITGDNETCLNEFYQGFDNPIDLPDIPAGYEWGWKTSKPPRFRLEESNIPGIGKYYIIKYDLYELKKGRRLYEG